MNKKPIIDPFKVRKTRGRPRKIPVIGTPKTHIHRCKECEKKDLYLQLVKKLVDELTQG